MGIITAFREAVSEHRWPRFVQKIAASSSRTWHRVEPFQWPNESDIRNAPFRPAKYYRVHTHPDPFLGNWQRYGLPAGWVHAGLDPVHLISTYGVNTGYGFLAEFKACPNDLWCGDFGIERTEHRCAHQLPRTAEFAAQVALIQQYIRGYGDLSLWQFFHEIPVSRASHPPLAQYLYRRNANGADVSALTPEEVTVLECYVGRTLPKVSSFSVRPDAVRTQIDPDDHHDQSMQPLVGGHPIEVFFSYLLIGFSTYDNFAEWVQTIDSVGFDSAIAQLKAKSISAAAAYPSSRWSWFATLDSYTSALQLHSRRLSHINAKAPERFPRAMELGANELLKGSNRKYFREKHPDDLSDLTWRIDDYITDGQIISKYMPRHKWR